jgi:hypothetical protein
VTRRIIVVVFMCVTCAVGAHKSSTASGEAPDPCTLVSRFDVAEAAGASVREGVSRLRNGALNCMFAGARGGQLAVLVRRIPPADSVPDQGSAPQAGDRSFLHHMQGKGGVLSVYAADYYLQISLFRLGEDSQTKAALRKLAGIAMARLRPQGPAETAFQPEPLR